MPTSTPKSGTSAAMTAQETRQGRRGLPVRSLLMPGIPLAILVAVGIVALAAPLIAPYSPIDGNLSERLKPPFWVDGGSSTYLLGTDSLGRACLSRLIPGARISLVVG